MKAIRETQKKYCSRAMMVSILICLGFFLLGQKAIGKGLILGSIFSVINFVVMGETLPARLAKEKKRTFFISLGSIFFRYMLLAIPIVVAIKYDTYNFYAAAAGLFAVQIVILFEPMIKLLPTRRRQQI